jgi:hypothetical protein
MQASPRVWIPSSFAQCRRGRLALDVRSWPLMAHEKRLPVQAPNRFANICWSVIGDVEHGPLADRHAEKAPEMILASARD